MPSSLKLGCPSTIQCQCNMVFEITNIKSEDLPAAEENVCQSSHPLDQELQNKDQTVLTNLITVSRGPQVNHSMRFMQEAPCDMILYLNIKDLCIDFCGMFLNKKSLYCKSLTSGRCIAVCSVCGAQIVSRYDFLLRLIQHFESSHGHKCVQLTLDAVHLHAKTVSLMAKALSNDRHFIGEVF